MEVAVDEVTVLVVVIVAVVVVGTVVEVIVCVAVVVDIGVFVLKTPDCQAINPAINRITKTLTACQTG